jgi:hypothetical protein
MGTDVGTWIAAGGILATALVAVATTQRQLRHSRDARETDYYRQLTPFLSFELVYPQTPNQDLRVRVLAHGGGAILT